MNRFEVPHWAWPEGHRIGSFELQAVASCGDTGIVYRAWDFALARPVAVKEYLPAGIARRNQRGDVHPVGPEDSEAFARGRRAFVAGCQTLARCDHPSLARVLHLTEAHGTTYCVMPWYSARSLLEVRPKIGHPVNEALLRSLLEDFLGALEAYHRVGGMHGGLSPSKVLLLDDDRGLLLGPSAGHATRSPSHDATRQPGDKAFAAVEQRTDEANAQPQGPWTDFYTLAAIVRFWITGLLPPGPGRGPPEPLAATIGRQFVDRPAVPYGEGLLRALDAAMSVDINKRPQSAAQFRRWLVQTPGQAAATPGRASAPVASVPSSPPPPASSQTHRVLPAADTRNAQANVDATGDPEEEEVDAATVETIRRMIASIPDAPGHAPRRPGQDGPTTGLGQARIAAAGVTTSAASASPGPRTWPRVRTGVGLLMAAAALVVIAAWPVMPWVDSNVRSDQTLSQAPPVEPADVPADLPSVPNATADSLPAPPAVQALPSPASPPVVMEPVAPEPTEQDATPASRPPEPSTPSPSGRPKELAAASPRALCGARTEFSLYRCMQQQCSLDRWQRHPQCLHLKATDTVE